MKIIIPGGHLTPALSLIDEIQTNHPKDSCVFVGREFSQLGQRSQEALEIDKRQVPFITFDAPRLRSKTPWGVLSYGLSFGASLHQAWQILKTEQPDILISFGGYLAVPLGVAAVLRGIPVVLHEQTLVAGQANLFLSKWAAKIAISHPSSATFFPPEKTILTGNPIRANLLSGGASASAPSWFEVKTFSEKHPLLYITGGNQGAHAINLVVEELLDHLTQHFVVVHACGNPTATTNDIQLLTQAAASLPPPQQRRYYVRSWISDLDLQWIYHHTHLAVSRAGANTVTELMLFSIPTVYIPLPQAKYDEQTRNVTPLAEAEASLILPQSQLTPENLLKALEQVQSKHQRYLAQLAQFSPPEDAAARLYQVLHKVVNT